MVGLNQRIPVEPKLLRLDNSLKGLQELCEPAKKNTAEFSFHHVAVWFLGAKTKKKDFSDIICSLVGFSTTQKGCLILFKFLLLCYPRKSSGLYLTSPAAFSHTGVKEQISILLLSPSLRGHSVVCPTQPCSLSF